MSRNARQLVALPTGDLGDDSFHVYASEYTPADRAWSPVMPLETIPLPFQFDSLTLIGGPDAPPAVAARLRLLPGDRRRGAALLADRP
jgi:hypothetical protein